MQISFDMSPIVISILGKWSSIRSKFINRSYKPFSDENGSQSIEFYFDFFDIASNFKKFYRISLEVFESDPEYCSKELDSCWVDFCSDLNTHLQKYWKSVENVSPEPNKALELAIIKTLVNPKTNEVSIDINFSEGFFNGIIYQVKDINAAKDVIAQNAFVKYYKYIE